MFRGVTKAFERYLRRYNEEGRPKELRSISNGTKGVTTERIGERAPKAFKQYSKALQQINNGNAIPEG